MLQIEKQFVQQLDGDAHAGNDKPGDTPTTAASTIRLDSRALTTARSRRGISSFIAILAITVHHRREK